MENSLCIGYHALHDKWASCHVPTRSKVARLLTRAHM